MHLFGLSLNATLQVLLGVEHRNLVVTFSIIFKGDKMNRNHAIWLFSIIGIVLLCAVATQSVAPVTGAIQSTTWSRHYGGNGDEFSHWVEPTADGGFIIAGLTNSFGASKDDAWIWRIDTAGNVVWARRLGSSGYDWLFSIQETSDGGFIAAGASEQLGLTGGEAWVVKLDQNGTPIWQKMYRGNSYSYIKSIRETSDGGFITAGYRYASATSDDAWVMKLTNDGAISWQKTYGTSKGDYANDILEAANGDFLIAGTMNAFNDNATSDAWLARITSAGNIVWEKRYAAETNLDFSELSLTSTGDIIASGQLVMKLDSTNGTVLWQKDYGGISALALTSGDHVVVASPMGSFASGNTDVWVAQLNGQTGTIMWQKGYGGASYESVRALTVAADGSPVIAGGTYTFKTGEGDAWLLKLDSSGDIADCQIEQIANISGETSTAVAETASATVKNTSVTAQTVAVSHSSTTAVVGSACPAPLSNRAFLPLIRRIEPVQEIAFVTRKDGNSEIYIWDLNEQTATRLTNNNVTDEGPSWSPDGNQIVFHSGRSGRNQLYIMDADGKNQRLLNASSGVNEWPYWSPTGNLIAFAQINFFDGSARTETFVMNADGTNPRRLTFTTGSTNGNGHGCWPSGWTPDGTQILYYCYLDGFNQLFIMNADGTNQQRLFANEPGWNSIPTMSPDGQSITYASYRSGNYEIFLADMDTSISTQLTSHPAEDWRPVWVPNGSKILFESQRNGFAQIYWMNPDGTEQESLINMGDYTGQPAWRPQP